MIQLLPLGLTFSRLVLGVAFPFISVDWQLWVILIGATTDLIDGRLARALGCDGACGRYLDPIADKTFVIGVLLTLFQAGLLSPAAVAVLLLRDIVVVAGVAILVASGRRHVLARLRPSWPGKVATGFQFVYILLITLVRDPVLPALIVVAIVTAIASVDYARRGWLAVRESPSPQPTLK